MNNLTTVTREQSRQEQARIESTKEYQFEQALYSLETSLAALDRIKEESQEREAMRAAGLHI